MDKSEDSLKILEVFGVVERILSFCEIQKIPHDILLSALGVCILEVAQSFKVPKKNLNSVLEFLSQKYPNEF
jgi:hypothetical protein